jgi:hypothetical protein
MKNLLLLLCLFWFCFAAEAQKNVTEAYGMVINVNGSFVTVKYNDIKNKNRFAVHTHRLHYSHEYKDGDIYPDALKHSGPEEFLELKGISMKRERFLTDIERHKLEFHFMQTVTTDSIAEKAEDMIKKYGKHSLFLAEEMLNLQNPLKAINYYEYEFWEGVRDYIKENLN